MTHKIFLSNHTNGNYSLHTSAHVLCVYPCALYIKVVGVSPHLLEPLFTPLEGDWNALMLSCVWLFATPWTEVSYVWPSPGKRSGLPFPSPRNLPNPGIKPTSLVTDSCIGQCILYDYVTWEALEGDVTHIVATWCRVKKHGPFTKEPEGALYYFWYICIFKVLLELKRH